MDHRYSSGTLTRVVGTAREAVILIRGPDQGPHFGNEKCATMIDHHWDAYRPKNTVILGLVEGLNNKIRFLQCRAYRYRDEG